MSTLSIPNINKEIGNFSEIIKMVNDPIFDNHIEELNISWIQQTINKKAPIVDLLTKESLLDNRGAYLSKKGELFFSRILIDFESLYKKGSVVDNKYKITKVLKIGKNSATFIAAHNVLHTNVVIKFLRPGASDNITKSLQIISNQNDIPNLVQPIDYFKTLTNDIYNNKVEIECIIFPYIQGVSLRTFLSNEDQPLNAHVVASFISQVGGVLSFLESREAYHGDLHSENIIVTNKNDNKIYFEVIDVSFGQNGSMDNNECKDNDYSYFKQHIWTILNHQQLFLSKMSLRKYLGAEIYYVVKTIIDKNNFSFNSINSLFKDNPQYQQYKDDKYKFIANKFSSPDSFKLQRYEEIVDPAVAVKLFVPFPELMKNIESFSNLVISGIRGSGKSTYLAALAFFPKVDDLLVDYKETFGIYFPCRQGEFRLFASDMVDYEKIGISRVKHVFIIKIIRRTLESIAEGIENKKLTEPSDYSLIKNELTNFLIKGEIISLDSDVISEIRNLVSIMIRIEMKELDNLFDTSKIISTKHLSNEINLLNFFVAIKKSIIELHTTRFHLLFDDAGAPNIPSETQKIINDFILSSNPDYCIKLSIEKYTYNFKTSTEKQLESGHDFFEYDIPTLFFTGTGVGGLNHTELRDYSKKIITQRLAYFNYKSTEIEDYLGSDYNYNGLIKNLSSNRRNAYYHGWEMVWRIADKTPRNLLELISEIFSRSEVDKFTEPYVIPSRNQDRSIRNVSDKRLRALSLISGKVKIHGQNESLGRTLFSITSAIGSAFRIYLKSQKGKNIKLQHLAIERNESSPLSNESESILKELIRYGILDESRLEFSRDDLIKKPIYQINRIYCPAFSITFRRDVHLRLSKLKFEELLFDPKSFIRDGTKMLRDNKPLIDDMFSQLNNE